MPRRLTKRRAAELFEQLLPLPTRVQRSLEKSVEKRFVRRCTEQGALARKMLGRAGDPDRQVFAPNGRTCLVELKRLGERARKLQLRRHREYRDLGFEVFVLDNVDKVDAWAARWLPHDFCRRDPLCVKRYRHRGACWTRPHRHTPRPSGRPVSEAPAR